MQQNGASLSSAHRTGAVIGQRSLLLAGILLGFALRLHRLGAESLWYDETVSVHLARKPIAAMIAHTSGDIHPPGYYLLLHLWQQVTTPTLAHGLEFLYAWPSLVAGVLVMTLIYALGRRLFDASTALLALWLAAVNPFQIWYSQEVRMYTIGATLALFCLWAALRFIDQRNPMRWLAAYVVGAAAGLYILYYFAFWLVGVNIAVLWLFWRDNSRGAQRNRRIAAWVSAQLAALLLFAPWLPTFVRQAVDPPVPPWRTPWESAGVFLASLAETGAAFVVGQSPPGELLWPWALLALLTLAAAFLLHRGARSKQTQIGLALVSIVVLAPILQLYLLTLTVTPVYHIRYVSLYAPLFLLVPAFLASTLWRTRRVAASAVMLLLWVAASLGAAATFWSEPRHRADDHRSAVAAIAAQWRPGDVILANAGWVYPVLTTYWPTELIGVDGVLPPEIDYSLPIDGYAQNIQAGQDLPNHPSIARSGSVDGPESLGWGNPASDFFAISTAATLDALTTLAEHGERIWHYRLYDTVSDPTGVIRTWFAENTRMIAEATIPGRDFGAVQLFAPSAPHAAEPIATANAVSASLSTASLSEEAPICFGDFVCLLDYAQNRTIEAGSYLYLPQRWQAPQPLPASPLPDLAVSLRIYDRNGQLAAQSDAPFSPPSGLWQAGEVWRQPFALPIGSSTKPGAYSLEAVVYRRDTGDALSPPPDAPSPDGQRLRLGTVTVTPPSRVPILPAALAAFDYIDLLEARVDRTVAQPGDSLHTAFFWRPRPNQYQDDYQVVLTLHNASGELAHEWRFPLGGAYPSGAWLPSLPVRDLYDLALPDQLPPGSYTIVANLRRTADDRPIPVRRGWLPAQSPVVATVQITAP
jgi:4-amino-4-deoxy-L-arabinose transferase-like glycosyltransferase